MANSEKGLFVDLSEVPELVSDLQEPTRLVEFRVGPVIYKFRRGADDPTPDYVIKISGLYVNGNDGRASKHMDDVV